MAATGEAMPDIGDGQSAGGAPPPPPLPPLPAVSPAEQVVHILPDAPIIKDGDGKLEPHEAQVVLRMEVATKGQARLLTYSSLILNLAFILAAFAMLALQGTLDTLQDLYDLYMVQLIITAVCLGLLVLMLVWMWSSMRRAARERRVWSARQAYFQRTAAFVLVLSTLYVTTGVATLASTVAQADCSYPWIAMAILEFFRRCLFAGMLFFLLIRLHNMSVYRGKGALEMEPDRMLLADRPFTDRARSHLTMFVVWLALVAAAAVFLAARLLQYTDGDFKGWSGCSMRVDSVKCQTRSSEVVGAVISIAAVFVFIGVWALVGRRALKDHKCLPYCRYKASHIFTRVQIRTIGPVQLAILFTTILLELVPAAMGSCASDVTSQMGSLPVSLALTVAATVLAILYMPVSSHLDSPLVQSLLQEWAWTLDSVPEVAERRNQALLDNEAAFKQGEETNVAAEAVGFLPNLLSAGMGWAAQVQDMASAQAQLAREPLFCLETCCKLFHWTRLAYRDDPESDPHVNLRIALPLFGLDQWAKVDDAATDTHCTLGWNAATQTVVVAFRGTASSTNAITDIKARLAWHTRHLPDRKHNGRRITCHAGFYKVWTCNDFCGRVLQKLREIDDAVEGPLRFWVTGHSLGGALAVLASADIRREHPESEISLYTFGCPRVFGKSGAREFNAKIPECWAIVNATDPVTLIPKWGFKAVGQKVQIDRTGNMMLRATYFESSVIHRGMDPKDHMTGTYALSLATFMKNQFSATTSLPGGAAGVEALVGALDVGRSLVLTNMSLEALRDPALLPAAADKEAKATPRPALGASASGSGGAAAAAEAAAAAGDETIA